MNTKSSYKDYLNDPRWIKRRNGILSRDNNTCQFCGAQDRRLHVHHLNYIVGHKPWEYENNDLITVCDRCHEMETESNGMVYDDYKELRATFKAKGLSMTLLHVILSNIIDAVTRQDEGEVATESLAHNYLRECICATQVLNDIYIAKKNGFDLRDLMQNCYHKLVQEYDKIK